MVVAEAEAARARMAAAAVYCILRLIRRVSGIRFGFLGFGLGVVDVVGRLEERGDNNRDGSFVIFLL